MTKAIKSISTSLFTILAAMIIVFMPLNATHAQYYGYGWYDENTGINHIFANTYHGCGNSCGGYYNNGYYGGYNYYNNYNYYNSYNYGYNGCCNNFDYRIGYNYVQPYVNYSYPSYGNYYGGCYGGCGYYY